jgi:hypothetical protein
MPGSPFAGSLRFDAWLMRCCALLPNEQASQLAQAPMTMALAQNAQDFCADARGHALAHVP